jgi:hypothetical protein
VRLRRGHLDPCSSTVSHPTIRRALHTKLAPYRPYTSTIPAPYRLYTSSMPAPYLPSSDDCPPGITNAQPHDFSQLRPWTMDPGHHYHFGTCSKLYCHRCKTEAAPPFPALVLLTYLRTPALPSPRPLSYFPLHCWKTREMRL